jgi:non-ribosomal peptide synthetase component F
MMEDRYADVQTQHETFHAQAAKTPDAVALVEGDVKMSYREVDYAVLSLAKLFRQQGVK